MKKIDRQRSTALKAYWRSVKAISARERVTVHTARTIRRIGKEANVPYYRAAAFVKKLNAKRHRRPVAVEKKQRGPDKIVLWRGREFPMSVFPDPAVEGRFNGIPMDRPHQVEIVAYAYTISRGSGESRREIRRTFDLPARATFSDLLSACYEVFRDLYSMTSAANEGVDIAEISIR